MARYLDLPGGCAPPSTWRYVHPVPSLRVGRNPAVGGGEGPYTVFIYTYTCRAVSTWRWDISPGGGSQSTLLPPALALLARTSLSPIGAPRWGLTPAPGDLRSIPPAVTNWPTANWPTPRLAPSLMTAPGNAPRAMAHRELASFPGHHCPRPSSRSSAPALAPSPPISPGQLAHPRTPSIPSIPHRAPPPLAVGAGSRPPITHAHACLLWPSLRRPRSARGLRGWGGRLQRFPSSSVAVELRPSAARPRDAPTRRPAHRLSHGLSGPRRPPLVRATAPVSGDDSQGEGFRTTCGPPGLEHPSRLANWQAHCLPSV